MNYLEKTLKINVRYKNWGKAGKLPYMITDRYDFRLAWLNEYNVLFVFAKDDLEQLAVLKKHLSTIHQIAEIPLVLVVDKLAARKRQQLVNSDIPFVVPDQQIYLPFLGVVLQERYSRDYSSNESLMPSSELLLLYFIIHRCDTLYMNDATRLLNFSAMTISRAIRQLESTGLISTYKEGVNKVIHSDLSARELFEKARLRLSSPVRKVVYIDKNDKAAELPLSGYSALSEYSLLNPPQVKCFAAGQIPEWASGISEELLDSDEQFRLEVWYYDPKVLSSEKAVSLLTLALALQDDLDERVQQELDDALNRYWEEYDG